LKKNLMKTIFYRYILFLTSLGRCYHQNCWLFLQYLWARNLAILMMIFLLKNVAITERQSNFILWPPGQLIHFLKAWARFL
jgi:hypothetical protein